MPADKRARYTGREPNRQLVQAVRRRCVARARPGEPAQGRARARLLPARASARSSTSSSSTRSGSAAGSPACSGPTARRSRRTSPSRRLFAVGRCRNGRLLALPARATGPRAAATPRPRLRSARSAATCPGLPLLSSPSCCAQSSSTSISRSPGPGPTSGRTATARSGSATGSTSTRPATTRRAPRPSPR